MNRRLLASADEVKALIGLCVEWEESCDVVERAMARSAGMS